MTADTGAILLYVVLWAVPWAVLICAAWRSMRALERMAGNREGRKVDAPPVA